jgi:N-acetylglucosamine kinase-like BadF-type ATPase
VKCYLGVDGGGSKTTFLLIDESGSVLATHTEGPAYYLEVGFDSVRTMLARGIKTILEPLSFWPSSINFTFIGLPSYGEDSSLLRALDAAASPSLQADRYRCGSDAICGWAGALATQDGINVISGTGSMAYGEFNGRSARAGGWGELFSDEGSEFWLAREGLNLFSCMSDGRVARSKLYGIVREYFKLQSDLDLCAAIYGKTQRSSLAALSALILDAAVAGDAQASALFSRAGDELVRMIGAVYRQLAVPENTPVSVSYSGGMFQQSDMLLKLMRAKLAGAGGHYRLVAPRLPPEAGAALYAAKLSGAPLSASAIATLESDMASEPVKKPARRPKKKSV